MPGRGLQPAGGQTTSSSTAIRQASTSRAAADAVSASASGSRRANASTRARQVVCQCRPRAGAPCQLSRLAGAGHSRLTPAAPNKHGRSTNECCLPSRRRCRRVSVRLRERREAPAATGGRCAAIGAAARPTSRPLDCLQEASSCFEGRYGAPGQVPRVRPPLYAKACGHLSPVRC